MIDLLLALDRQIFLFLFHLPHVSLLNHAAFFLSAVGTWGGVWLVIAVYLFFREEKHDRWFFLPAALVSTGGLLSEFVLKNIVVRPRPTDLMNTYSFPSTHAVLAFAFAYVLSREEPSLAKWFYLLAMFIAVSRVYLGVHYPSDVIAGAVLGIIIGWFSLTLGSYARPKSIRSFPKRSKKIQSR